LAWGVHPKSFTTLDRFDKSQAIWAASKAICFKNGGRGERLRCREWSRPGKQGREAEAAHTVFGSSQGGLTIQRFLPKKEKLIFDKLGKQPIFTIALLDRIIYSEGKQGC